MLYEVHVRGFSQLHPGVPEAQRGSYAGLASDAAIAHFKRLGITAVSLLPVQQHLNEARLVEMGLTNYWGYNTLRLLLAQSPTTPAPATRATNSVPWCAGCTPRA